MRRFTLLLVLGLLVADAAGVAAFVISEPCTGLVETQPDGNCPALCVRCACCAQPVIPGLVVSLREVIGAPMLMATSALARAPAARLAADAQRLVFAGQLYIQKAAMK